MATTDARAGFRLPWSSERSNSEQTETDQLDATEIAETATDVADGDVATDSPNGVAPAAHDPGSAPTGEAEAEPAAETPEPAAAVAPRTGAKKPSKFMADLTKAMQAAAEEARTRTLTQFQADAKSYVEGIHARSSEEATELRRKADDDVASVREWSKAEIARIREEMEGKISARKTRLEGEIEEHAALIEREIEGVQARVAAFEGEMATFFERLLADDDPTHFATMAENLPEAPAWESSDLIALAEATSLAAAVETPTAEEAEASEADPTSDVIGDAEVSAETAETAETTAAPGSSEPTDESTVSAEADADATEANGPTGSGDETGDVQLDREAAFAAIQAAAEAAASAEVATNAAARAEAVADVAIGIVGSRDGEADTEPEDPRVAALAMTPGFDAAAAEAEAAASADAGGVEEIPEIADDALAARLAGLVPGKTEGSTPASDAKSTQVIVVGLVSVASIASFKRHLGRLSGVQSVGVSSGPDGEFVFTVHHGADVVLRDLIPSLPSFQARVTGQGDTTINVTAHDPESDS